MGRSWRPEAVGRGVVVSNAASEPRTRSLVDCSDICNCRLGGGVTGSEIACGIRSLLMLRQANAAFLERWNNDSVRTVHSHCISLAALRGRTAAHRVGG